MSLQAALAPLPPLDYLGEAEQIAVVERDGRSISRIRHPSLRVQTAAVRRKPLSVLWIKNPSEAALITAVELDPSLLQFLSNPSEAVLLAAVRKDGMALQFIASPSRVVAYTAMQQNPEAGRFVPDEKLRARMLMHIESDKEREAWLNRPAKASNTPALRSAWTAHTALGR